MHPVFTQVPPNLWRSMMATVLPAPANRAARDGPAWPVPMMIASTCFILVRPPYGVCPSDQPKPSADAPRLLRRASELAVKRKEKRKDRTPLDPDTIRSHQ